MKRLITLALLLGVSLGSSACSAIAAENEEKETQIKFSDAPAAVQKTMTKEAGGAKIDTVEKEVENGKTVYEAEVVIEGKRYEIEVAEDGTLLSKEQEDEDDDDDDDDDDK